MEENECNQLEQFLKLEEAISKLTVKQQDAVHWAIKYFNVLEEIGKELELTAGEIDCKMKSALERENYATYIFLYIVKYMKESNENEENLTQEDGHEDPRSDSGQGPL